MSKKKYIDADIVNLKLKQICDKRNTSYGVQFGGRAKDFAQLTDNIPAADVEVVRHGEWIDIPLNSDPNDFAYKYNLRTKCSVCGFAMPREYPRFNICPNCGAKMRGEAK